MASVQGALAMFPIQAYGSEEQQERWLPKMGQGEIIGCCDLTEPAHGSNPSATETRTRRDGSGYAIDGSKNWITNSPTADVVVVWAQDESDPETPARGFLAETDRDGVSTNEIEEKLSLRASIAGEIALNDLHVPAENLLPGVEGMKGRSAISRRRGSVSRGVRRCRA